MKWQNRYVISWQTNNGGKQSNPMPHDGSWSWFHWPNWRNVDTGDQQKMVMKEKQWRHQPLRKSGGRPPISEIINCVLLGVDVRLPHWIGLVVFCDIVANVLEFHSQSQVPPKVRLAVQEVGAQRSVGAGRWVCRKKKLGKPEESHGWHMLTYVDIIFWKWQHGYKLGGQMRPLMINHGNLAGRDDLDTTQRS